MTLRSGLHGLRPPDTWRQEFRSLPPDDVGLPFPASLAELHKALDGWRAAGSCIHLGGQEVFPQKPQVAGRASGLPIGPGRMSCPTSEADGRTGHAWLLPTVFAAARAKGAGGGGGTPGPGRKGGRPVRLARRELSRQVRPLGPLLEPNSASSKGRAPCGKRRERRPPRVPAGPRGQEGSVGGGRGHSVGREEDKRRQRPFLQREEHLGRSRSGPSSSQRRRAKEEGSRPLAPGGPGRMAEAGICRQGRRGATPLLLLSLVAAGSGLRCFQCVGMFRECVHTEQLCAPRDRSCFSSSIKLFYPSNGTGGVFMLPDLEIAEYVMKGCSVEGVSNWTAELSSEDDREVHTTFRCDQDLCNAHIPGAAFASTAQLVPNGMECYSCFDRGTGDCAPGNATRIRCSGDMDQCMDFTVTDGPWKVTYRACALETLCRQQYLLPELLGRLEIRCCSAPLCNDGHPGGLLKGSLCRHFAQKGTEREPENGLSCASCCDSGQGECSPGNGTVVRCRGEQRVCVNVTEGGRTLLRGCSLEKLCRETPRLLGLGREASTRCCSGSFCNGGAGKAGGRNAAAVLLLPATFTSASALASLVLAQRRGL